MSVALPLLSGLAGGIAGWLLSRIVDRSTQSNGILSRVLMVAGSAGSVVLLSLKFGTPGSLLFVYSALVLALIAVTVFDLRKHKIPHIITIPGIIAGLILGSLVLPRGMVESLLGLLVGGGVLLAATLIESLRKKEIGGGDWKLAAMIGSFVGPQKMIVALVLTGVFGLIGGIALAVTGSQRKPQALGPWLSAGAVASILLG